MLAWLKKKCSLEVAETNSVVVKIPKLFLVGEQVRDELVNVNKMPTNLEGGVVESAFFTFGVFSQKTKTKQNKKTKKTAGLLCGLSNNK